jgi:hypothetical protein
MHNAFIGSWRTAEEWQMTTAFSHTRSQEGFSRLFGPVHYATDTEAKAARDARYRELRAQGYQCKRWVLKDQLTYNDGTCDVYMLNSQR